MLHNTFARLKSVRVRITIVATVLTGVALTVAAVLLVSTVEGRLEAEARDDAERAAAKVADALQGGLPFSQAVEAPAPAPGTLVYIVGPGGDVLASTPGSAAAGIAGVGVLPDSRLLAGGSSVAVTSQLVSTAGASG